MTNRDDARRAKIDSRCALLADLIKAIRPIYERADSAQRAFIETMIGAAIWYIPKPADAWTGCISRAALQLLHPNQPPRFSLSEEHVYPRKVAARALLTDLSVDGARLAQLYREKYGRIHYITPDENKAVTQHQRADVFTSPEEAYANAGIELIQVDRGHIRDIKKRVAATIEMYLGRKE